MSIEFEPRGRSRVRRAANRAAYDRDTVYEIIDACRLCHVAFVDHGGPCIIPTIHARDEDTLLFHGARASRMMQQLASGAPISAAFTLLDGLVLARSAFHHSMNYRSVVVFGTGSAVSDESEKREALDRLVESVVPGRTRDARPANAKELRATTVVRLVIEDASAKIRTGPPKDEPDDWALPVWAGEIPLQEFVGPPIPDPALREGLAPPAYLNTAFHRS